MYQVKRDVQVTILKLLLEGVSIRSIERLTGVHRDTIMRLLVRAGNNAQKVCEPFLEHVVCRYLQLDEIWTFCRVKQHHLKDGQVTNETLGDQWCWVALDSETKLIPMFMVGKRTTEMAKEFLKKLFRRLAKTCRIQITSDPYKGYLAALSSAYQELQKDPRIQVDYPHAILDYATLSKTYDTEHIGPGRYAPPRVVGVERTPIVGYPKEQRISTSHIERQNLTVRMAIRRFTRLTNAFSKKLENLKAACDLHFAHYNFGRLHQTLGKMTPAMAAGIAQAPWPIELYL